MPCVFGVTTDGRDAMRGILVGVAEGTARESYGTLFRSDDTEDVLWREGGAPAAGRREWRFCDELAVGSPLPLTDTASGWVWTLRASTEGLRVSDGVGACWSPPEDSVCKGSVQRHAMHLPCHVSDVQRGLLALAFGLSRSCLPPAGQPVEPTRVSRSFPAA